MNWKGPGFLAWVASGQASLLLHTNIGGLSGPPSLSPEPQFTAALALAAQHEPGQRVSVDLLLVRQVGCTSCEPLESPLMLTASLYQGGSLCSRLVASWEPQDLSVLTLFKLC